MRIAIAADHNGVHMKKHLTEWLTAQGHKVADHGTNVAETIDYPPLCAAVCAEITKDRADRAIIIGGTGGGEAIACNKIRGIRAGLGHSVFLAEISAAHNKTNVLILGAKVISEQDAAEITNTWLTTPFKGAQHQTRLDQIAAMEKNF
jgi:ribose 5-phosphate isomerase B